MDCIAKLQGRKLWVHSSGLKERDLTQGQLELVCEGYAGPPVSLDGIDLSVEQRARCSLGLDERQLRMLKAQVTFSIIRPVLS